MQDNDPNLPGYYKKRKVEVKEVSDGEEDAGIGLKSLMRILTIVWTMEAMKRLMGKKTNPKKKRELIGTLRGSMKRPNGKKRNSKTKRELIRDVEASESLFESEDDNLKKMDGFAPVGVGYGNITEETLDRQRKEKVSKVKRKRLAREAHGETEEVTVCARCHSLRNYGQVKIQAAENLIPDFDFGQLITTWDEAYREYWGCSSCYGC